MHLPSRESCQSDPFLNGCWLADEKGILKKKIHANNRFLDRRRIFSAFEMLKKHMSPDRHLRVADFACGTGNFGILMAEEGYTVDFIDNEPKFFDYIRMKTNSQNIHFIQGDVNRLSNEVSGYSAIFFGEAIEHMADPLATLKNIQSRLKTGGLLCLTTPNGDFVDGTEPSWEEVKGEVERNQKLANTIGNHVCEFRVSELKELLKQAGFGLLDHEVMCSKQISKRHLLRFMPERWLWPIDRAWSKKTRGSKNHGRIQVVIAQRFH